MAPRLIVLLSSGSKKKGPRYTCQCEAKPSHWQRMWDDVSSSAPHLLHGGISDSSIRWRCLLRVLCPVRRPVTALDCVLLKDRALPVSKYRRIFRLDLDLFFLNPVQLIIYKLIYLLTQRNPRRRQFPKINLKKQIQCDMFRPYRPCSCVIYWI
jgi:hypothetical protein